MLSSKDEVHMREMNEKLEKLKNGSSSQSIRDDLKKDDLIFSVASSRVVFEIGNVELFELRKTTDTIQCHSCLRHVPRGLKFCDCGVRLRPDEETTNRISARFQALIAPYNVGE